MRPTEITCLVSRPRGAWKWQDRYAIARCALHRTRDGRLVWRTVGYLAADIPSVGRRRRAPEVEVDFRRSRHHTLVTPEDVALLWARAIQYRARRGGTWA